MALAAADTIYNHFIDLEESPLIITLLLVVTWGIGQKANEDILAGKGFDISPNYTDCGVLILSSPVGGCWG